MRNFKVMDTAADRPVVVVGSGAAGLAAALALSPAPVRLVTAGRLDSDSSSAWAQGGIAAALGADDSPELHARDTVAAGAGLVDEPVAREITEAAPDCIEWLARLGVPFDRAANGEYSLGLEGAHSRRRIARVGGDGVGQAVVDALAAAVRRSEHIEVLERHSVIELLGGGVNGHDRVGRRKAGDHPAACGRSVRGVLAVDRAGRRRTIDARAVVLATGGVGSLYSDTTNPRGAFGYGIALALRAGAAVRDAEFVQFHPTAIDIGRTPMPLATEALRGEGALLVDGNGEPILEGGDGELAPRDVVARAIARRLGRGGDRTDITANGRRMTGSAESIRGAAASGAGTRRRLAACRVYLDATHAIGAAMPERFPAVTAACRAAGIDPVTEPIPVRPAAHYHMGGIAVDLHGRSGVSGLYACGEVACTGLHGANRLASNSLLEAIVSARRVAQAIAGGECDAGWARREVVAQRCGCGGDGHAARIREISDRYLGVERDGAGLRQAIAELTPLAFDDRWAAALAALAIAVAAERREESRGGHYRGDYPHTDAAQAHSRLLTFRDIRDAAAAIAGDRAPATEPRCSGRRTEHAAFAQALEVSR